MNLPSAKSLLLCSLLFASAACSEASIGDGEDGNADPDAGANIDPVDADLGAPDADPDVPDAEPQLQTSTIQQASSNDITPANSINCGTSRIKAISPVPNKLEPPTPCNA